MLHSKTSPFPSEVKFFVEHRVTFHLPTNVSDREVYGGRSRDHRIDPWFVYSCRAKDGVMVNDIWEKLC
jgi:hypothetical protein